MASGETNRVTTAVLLAAGTGSRLQPLTNDAPKCLSDVNGITILERLVRCLRGHGVERLIVVVGYLDQRVREFLGEWQDALQTLRRLRLSRRRDGKFS